MTLREQLQADLKDAMKSGDEARKTLIRGAMTALRETEQRKREDLVKKALKKHNVTKPVGKLDETVDEAAAKMAAYQQAMDAALVAENVEAASTLDDAEELSVIQKLVKQRQESIEQAQQAGRTDLAESEMREMKMLEGYLPQQMSREEIEAAAREVIAETGAASEKDMGKVMGALRPRVQGKADGKLVSEVVRSLLS
jgi:uncharacterized protein